MIDLRSVVPLEPIHAHLNPKTNRLDFFCKEMDRIPNNSYQCVDTLCRLVYNKFCFIGYYKNPNLPFPQITYPDNILDKARVCQPRCSLLKLSDHTGFYICAVCGGNFMKNPECGITSVPGDWLLQDPRVLKYFIHRAQESAQVIRKNAAENPDSELWKFLLERLEAAEKIFITEVLLKCRL